MSDLTGLTIWAEKSSRGEDQRKQEWSTDHSLKGRRRGHEKSFEVSLRLWRLLR